MKTKAVKTKSRLTNTWKVSKAGSGIARKLILYLTNNLQRLYLLYITGGKPDDV